MSQYLPEFDAAYAGEPMMEGLDHVPWNIGEPQPPIAQLIDSGDVRGPVLDAGCGVGETTQYLAARGFEAVGVDASPNAIGQARESAGSRGVAVEFEVADVTELSGYDGRFRTVIDSTLFHSMPVEARPAYLAAIARSSTPGAVLHVLVFSNAAQFPTDQGPKAVGEQELRDAVGAFWTVDDVRPSHITAVLPEEIPVPHERDARGRALLPAFLLRAHLPG